MQNDEGKKTIKRPEKTKNAIYTRFSNTWRTMSTMRERRVLRTVGANDRKKSCLTSEDRGEAVGVEQMFDSGAGLAPRPGENLNNVKQKSP